MLRQVEGRGDNDHAEEEEKKGIYSVARISTLDPVYVLICARERGDQCGVCMVREIWIGSGKNWRMSTAR